MHLFQLARWFGAAGDEGGVSAVEYALLIAILAAALILTLGAMGESVTSPMSSITDVLS